jgi:fibronectin-binding autotransporter adhesin
MSDNVAITAGAGTTVSTEEITTLNGGAVSAQHIQRVAAAVRTADGAAVDLPGSTADGLLVNLGANNDVTVTGSITANAGTNLNTSTLALESGGNLATAVASLGVIDDWDESDRAKVNPIVGQAGIAAGAGAVSATTQRTTLASDDPAVVALQVLDNIVAGNEAQVDVVTLPSGSIAATTAKTADFDTGAGTDTVSMFGVALPASGGAVAGGTSTNPLRVDPTGSTTQPVSGTVALGAGSASIGTLGANNGVDVGDVTINNASGASAVNIQDGGNSLTVDGTVAATQSGNWTARVADGAGNALTSKAPGSERALSVAIVDGSGAQVTSFGGSGGTSMTDDAAFTPASGAFTPMGGIVTSDSVDSGDGGAFAMLANRQQKVTLYDSSGVELAVGGGTQYTEDAAAAADPIGNALNLVRDDARGGSLTTTNGDNVAARGTNAGELYVKHVDSIPVTDNAGSLTIDAPVGTPAFVRLSDGSAAITTLAVSLASVPSHAVTNAGTFGVQVDGAALTALQVIDNLPNTLGSTTSGQSGALALGAVTTAAPTYTTDQSNALSLQTDGALRAAVTNTVTVASHAVTNAGTFAVQAAQSGTWTVQPGNTANSTAWLVTGTGGTFPVTDSGGSLTVDGSVSLAAAIPAGTNNIGDVDVLSIAAGDNNIGNVDIVTMPNVTLAAGTNTNEVVGDVAHDAAVAGNPVLIAVRANTNEPTAVAAGDATHLWADLFGRLVTIPGHPNPETPVTVNATSSGNTTVIASPGASLSLYICKVSVHNRDAANVVVTLQDGTGGTARWRAELAAEGGGSLIDFGARGWKLTADTLLNVNLGGASSVDVNVTDYYIAA